MSEELTIERLGAQGDGIAATAQGPVYVAFALPGERVSVERKASRATLVEVLEPSPDRVAPACRHFGVCGGCSLQHLIEPAYLDFKRERVIEALRSLRIETNVPATVRCAPASRRRAVFTARRTERGMLLGYNRALSHELVDIGECPILLPEIVAALPTLRHLAAIVASVGAPFHVTVTATQTGLDVAFSGSGKVNEEARAATIRFAVAERLARVSVDGEILIEPAKPTVAFGKAYVTPPPGAFLQAVPAAEAVMAALVREHVGKARRVADLFCGAGAFALRLAEHAEVHAVEEDAAALAALDRARRSTPGLKPVSVERRDLFRRPLTAKELGRFDAVVFDPPRAGAEDQSKQIARSDVPRVAAVSCNPISLARDLRILIDGGYRLVSVTPVDQFLWSSHVEAVALLEKPKRRR
ncbi:MAG: class I SAM-dependent RNA methyltransferase [Rhizobiaceae bacterium]